MSEVHTPPSEELQLFDVEEEEEEVPSVSPFEGTAVLLRFGRERVPVTVWSHQPNKSS